MPFIGRDWRSPGDQWVRTTEGWERMRLWRVKIFENLNQNAVARTTRLAMEDLNLSREQTEFTSRRQPYIIYNSGSTKEKLELTSLSEAMVRLDMTGAARDISRANYVAKLITLIMGKKMPALSGTSQKLVINILDAMVNEAIKSELNIGIMKDLLGCATDALNEGKHFHIGSQCLWSKHFETVNKLSNKLSEYQMKETCNLFNKEMYLPTPGIWEFHWSCGSENIWKQLNNFKINRNTDGRLMLYDLPTDCLRVIFSQISDHKDVIRAGLTSTTLNRVTEESSLWREMCLFHFNNRQILTFLPKQSDSVDIDWKNIYRRCYKRFGRKDTFADMLAICSHCCGIHWKSLGHPCISDKSFSIKELSPKDFLSLFKL